MCIRKTGESTAVRFNTVSSVLGNLQILCPVTILSSWAVLERDLGIYGAVRLSVCHKPVPREMLIGSWSYHLVVTTGQ